VDLSLTLSERNLGELPVRGAYFIFMPVKIAGSSGGPGRAVALLPE
jgi:kynurenine formamidase